MDKEQIIIDVNKHFKRATNDSGQPLTYIINYANLYEAIIQINEEFIKKVQECEELKEKLYQIEDVVKPINEQLPEDNVIRQIMLILNDCNKLEPSRYRKALEEIEGLISDYEFIRCPINDDVNCNYFTRNKILDIINKAKGGEDD